NPVTVTVAKDGTSTTVVSSANPVAIGQKVTFTADVQGGNSGPQPMVASRSQHTTPVPITGGGVAQPTGSVQFSIDGGSPITEPLGKNGAAQLPTSFTTAGSHTVVATYSGDGNYLPSQGQVSVLVGSVVPPCPWASYSSEPGQEHQDRALAAVFANW
ncbi:MAG: Ig-like domain-containing protein, partial [Thermoguttaceae bacterium]